MYKLYGYTLCPFTRKIRFLLSELNQSFAFIEEKFWTRRDSYLRINPTGMVPTLVKEDGISIYDSNVICEYLFQKHSQDSESSQVASLLPLEEAQYIKTKKHAFWFDSVMFSEVTYPLLSEKVLSCFKSEITTPNPSVLEVARYNLDINLEYLAFHLSKSNCIIGDTCTLADISAACQISVIDYLNEIRWKRYSKIKDWYSVIKSKPSFRTILKEKVSGFPPPSHYEELDF